MLSQYFADLHACPGYTVYNTLLYALHRSVDCRCLPWIRELNHPHRTSCGYCSASGSWSLWCRVNIHSWFSTCTFYCHRIMYLLSIKGVSFCLNCLEWLTFILMDCCHCYQVHFGDTVSHVESTDPLCTSYQALGPLVWNIKLLTRRTNKTRTRNCCTLRCAHYITVSSNGLVRASSAPPTPSILTHGDCRSSSPPSHDSVLVCWHQGMTHGATHLCRVTTPVTHTWHYLLFLSMFPDMTCNQASLGRYRPVVENFVLTVCRKDMRMPNTK